MVWCARLISVKPTRATAYKFLRRHSRAVLATVTKDNTPSSTPVTYTLSPEKTIYFATRDQTTKYFDILNNENVALTFIDSRESIAVNLVGTAQIVNDSVLRKNAFRAIGQLDPVGGDPPPVIKHKRGDLVVIEVTPKRIQYADFTRPFSETSKHIFDL